MDEYEETLRHPEITDSAPSIRDVTCCSMIRAEAPDHENDTPMLCCGADGEYCTFSRGSMAKPMTDTAIMMSSTENGGMPRRGDGVCIGGIIAAIYIFRNRPRE